MTMICEHEMVKKRLILMVKKSAFALRLKASDFGHFWPIVPQIGGPKNNDMDYKSKQNITHCEKLEKRAL